MEIAELVLEYVRAAAWPVVALFALLLLRKPLQEMFNRISQVSAFGMELRARDKGLDEARERLQGAASEVPPGIPSPITASTGSPKAEGRKSIGPLSPTPYFMDLGPGDKAQALVESHPAPGPFVVEGEGWRHEKHAFLDAYNRATSLIWDTLRAYGVSPSRLTPRTAEDLAAKTQVGGWNELAQAWDEVDEGESIISQIADPEERSRFLAKWLETTYLFEKKFLQVLQSVSDRHSSE